MTAIGDLFLLGLPTDMYSGLAEACGLYNVLCIFYHYVHLYPIIFTAAQKCMSTAVTMVSSRGFKDQHHPLHILRKLIHNDYTIFTEI